MTNKEISQRLRDINNGHYADQRSIAELINELDPTRPEPNTWVWWKWKDKDKEWTWRKGIVSESGSSVFNAVAAAPLDMIEWKPARIAGPMQVIVDVPRVSDWPEYGDTLIMLFEGETKALRYRDVITRAEAERREAEI